MTSFFEAFPYVSINGVQVGIRSVPSVLARHAVGVVIVSDHDIYNVFLRGTGTLLRNRDRFFMICCHHQIKGEALDRVGFFPSEEPVVITSAGVKIFDHQTDTDLSDLAIFDFTEPVKKSPGIERLFFNFNEHPPNAYNTDTAFVQVAGFTTHHQAYELGDERNHLGLVKLNITYVLDSPSNDRAILKLRPAQEALHFDPDGLSGGSAFSVQFVDEKAKAFFAGIVCRAGKNSAYIIKSNYILAALNTFDQV